MTDNSNDLTDFPSTSGKDQQKTGFCRLVCFGLIFGALMGCQPPPQSPAAEQSPSSSASIIANESDVVGDLIEQIEAEQQPSAVATGPDETVIVSVEQAPKAIDDEDKEQKALAEQALNAALNLLKNKRSDTPFIQDFTIATKAKGALRVGLLLPFTGQFAQLGRDVAGGAEMALFQVKDPDIELLYFDTAGGKLAGMAANEAVTSEVDIVIGPLFTQSVDKARPVLRQARIPALSLSNNLEAAAPGHWVLGYLPEQQIDHLLDYVITQNKTRVAIIAAEDKFGQRLLAHTQSYVSKSELGGVKVTVLSDEILADEESLKEAIRIFSRQQKTTKPYDALILAGNPDFILRTAPVLSYYDLGPDNLLYLGTDLWARPELLAEPSLQGSLVTQVELPENDVFEDNWQTIFKRAPNIMAKLGFDAFAVIAVTKKLSDPGDKAADADAEENADENADADEILAEDQDILEIDWLASLTRKEGFQGFSGRFNLLSDGVNQRDYKIRTIITNQLMPR